MELLTLLRELDDLKLETGEYAITASGAMAGRGIREARDLDLIVTPRLWEELASRFGVSGGKIVIGERIEVVGEGSPFSEECEEQIRRAEMIGGRLYALLTDVRRAKLALDRPKDRRDVELIDAYLVRTSST